MNIADLSRTGTDGVYALMPERPLPMSLAIGSSIVGVWGTMWITQEGMHDDVVLTPGDRFSVKRTGLLVLSALHGSAGAYVLAPPEEKRPRARAADPHVIAAIEAHARALRREAFGRVAHCAWEGLVRGLRRLKAGLRG